MHGQDDNETLPFALIARDAYVTTLTRIDGHAKAFRIMLNPNQLTSNYDTSLTPPRQIDPRIVSAAPLSRRQPRRSVLLPRRPGSRSGLPSERDAVGELHHDPVLNRSVS